ncbi:MAG: rod shape-determining protein RodA [Myxococcota bacterium]|nr:rod shape-determining protein RodA [Myxococcota bacterium]
MSRLDRRAVQNFDWWLLGLVLLLAGLGMANLVSATYSEAEGWLSPAVRRQLVSFGIGMAALIAATAIDYRHLERLAPLLYIGSLLLLASTLVFAPVIRGNQSWLVFGPLRFQPAELAKLGMVVALARYFLRHPPGEIRRLRDLVRPALIAAGPVALIVLQRDLGVALLTLLVAATFLPFVRIPNRAWVAVGGSALAVLAVVWVFALAPYQKSRVLDVIDPGRDPLSSGYQTNQSRIAIGSGGLVGKGYLQGTQTQLRFLPTQHTDFVFSVLAEEWGLVGASTVLLLYLVLLGTGLAIARGSKDRFGALLAVGIVGTLFWPAAVNVAMVLGLAPVIGVTLPLFSYGGSALITALAGLGLLLNVSMRRYMF